MTPSWGPCPTAAAAPADEQLAGALSCVALVEQGQVPAAAACAWLKPALDDGYSDGLHRMFYAASRGLHARK